MMNVSEVLGGMGSVATSAVPVFENTTATCGNPRIVLLDHKLHGLRLGKRRARNSQGIHGDVLLVERRNEYLAEPGEEQARHDEQDQRRLR